MEPQPVQENPTIPPIPVVPTVPAPQSSQGTSVPQKHTGLTIIIMLLIIIILGMSASVFYFWQKTTQLSQTIENQTSIMPSPAIPSPTIGTDVTANWKTIKNVYWTFKVPTNLHSVECNSHDFLLIGSNSKGNSLFDKDKVIECNFDQPGDLMSFFRGQDNTQNTVMVPTNTDPTLDPVVSETKTIEVAGIKATFQKETTSTGQGTGSRYKVYIHQANYMDVISLNDITQKTLFNQILSTVVFNTENQTYTPKWSQYSNGPYAYTFTFPVTWKITEEDLKTPATQLSKTLKIFNPEDKPEEGFYSSLTIEYVGMVQDLSLYKKTVVNGIEMYMLNSTHGVSYYVNIPDTDAYLHITGAGGTTPNEKSNEIIRQIFSSFKFTR